MSAARFFLALTVALSGAAIAQQAPQPADGPALAAPATALPHDCAKPMPRHDHSAERGTPTPMPARCAMAEPVAAGAKPVVKPGHNHSKIHKLM